jgi:hypothetical protein
VESLIAIDERVVGALWPPIWAAISAARGRLGASELWQERSRPLMRQCTLRRLAGTCAAAECRALLPNVMVFACEASR